MAYVFSCKHSMSSLRNNHRSALIGLLNYYSMHYVIDPERGQSYALLSRVFFSIMTSVKVNDNKEDNMIIIEDYELPSWRI